MSLIPVVMLVTLIAAASTAEAKRVAPPARDEGRLFRIVSKGIPDSYVLGTIHAADPRTAQVTPPIVAALAASRMLAVELIPEPLDPQLHEFEYIDRGTASLRRLLAPDAYARLSDALVTQGMSASDVDRLKPWAAMMRIGRAQAGDRARPASNGPAERHVNTTGTAAPLDQQLYVEARKRRMNVQPLEMLDEQVAAFDSIPVESQVALLIHALDRRSDLAVRSEQTIDAWLRGDLDAIARIAANDDERFRHLRPHYARLIEHVIEGRTALMHHRLALPLRSGRVLVAIGALHLHGGKGLLALLRAEGYRIVKVW